MPRKLPKTFDEIPDPPRPVLTDDQKYRRHRRFAVVLNAFVLAYSVLHKLIIPLYVGFAHSATFAAADAWWLYHAGVAVLLARKKWDDGLLRVAAFFGIGGAACQVVVSLLERNWHSVSLWVTSASTLWVAGVLLRGSRRRPVPPHPWTGPVGAIAALVFGFVVQFSFFGFTLKMETAARREKKVESATAALPELADPDVCGVKGFSIPVEKGSPIFPSLSLLGEVAVKACGFPSAAARFDPGKTLVVRNATEGYMNVKVYTPWQGQWRPLRNMPLPPGMTHDLNPAELAGHPVLLLASDADPGKGLLFLVASPEAVESLVPSGTEKGALRIDRGGVGL